MSSQVSLSSSTSKSEEALLQEEAYNDSFNDKSKKIAFLYRKDEIQKPIEEEFQPLVRKFLECKDAFVSRLVIFFTQSGEKINHNVENFIQQEIDYFQNIGLFMDNSLRTMIKNMASAINQPTMVNSEITIKKDKIEEILTESQTEEITEDLMEFARSQAFEKYFNQSYKDIIAGGMVYALPQGKHQWSFNASWLRGHFNKETDTFVIKTPIDQEGMFRGITSHKAGDMGSGFFREIAICRIMGYKLMVKDGQIIMHHNNPAALATIQLQDIVKFTEKEMAPFYQKAIEEYNELSRQLTLTSMLSQAKAQLNVTRGPITSWMIQTKYMNKEQADSVVKRLIKASVHGPSITINSAIGESNSSYIKVQTEDPEEIEKIQKMFGSLINSIRETKPNGEITLRKFETEKPVKNSEMASSDSMQSRNNNQSTSSTSMLNSFNNFSQTQQSLEERANSSHQTIRAAIETNSITSLPMNNSRADQIKQELKDAGVEEKLMIMNYRLNDPNSYTLQINSYNKLDIDKAKNVLRAANLIDVPQPTGMQKPTH